jgi:cell division protease FtsH
VVLLLAAIFVVLLADALLALLASHIVHFAGVTLPRYDAELIPGGILVGILMVVIAAPLVGAGRSPHVLYRPEEIGLTLADVVGADGVVDEVVRTLNLFLAHRTFAERLGGNPRRGVLFEGPPGTGKTYIAKAMAAEAGVPFLFVSSSAFQSMYYGQTNRKIRSFFRALRRHARAEGGAIGFIEEIDAIGMARSGLGPGAGREGITGVVNELLVQMQSFEAPTLGARLRNSLIDRVNLFLPAGRRFRKRAPRPANILVIGATNRAQDLDPALLRPGRFDRTIRVDLPDRAGRLAILDYYLARKSHAPELDDPARRASLAASTFGYSPVMIERLLDEALVWALRDGRDAMTPEDVQQARMTYTPTERAAIATHEAGHATVAYFAAPERRLDVLSIVKRRDALGLLAHSEAEERFTRNTDECLGLLQVAMGGLAAEEAFLGQHGTGVAGDLTSATRLAAEMAGAYGMAGPLVSLGASRAPGDLVTKALSDDKSRALVEQLLDDAKRRASEVVSAHRHVVEVLRDALLEHDELVGEEIVTVIEGAL